MAGHHTWCILYWPLDSTKDCCCNSDSASVCMTRCQHTLHFTGKGNVKIRSPSQEIWFDPWKNRGFRVFQLSLPCIAAPLITFCDGLPKAVVRHVPWHVRFCVSARAVIVRVSVQFRFDSAYSFLSVNGLRMDCGGGENIAQCGQWQRDMGVGCSCLNLDPEEPWASRWSKKNWSWKKIGCRFEAVCLGLSWQ